MKTLRWFALFLIALVACTDAPTEAGNMPIGPVTPGSYVTVLPDVNPNPYTQLQAPSPSMDVVSADIQTLALSILNVQNSSLVFANLHTFAPQTDGGKFFVSGMGWYGYTQSTPFTPATPWVISADVGGQFSHELLALINLKKLPSIGPVPGESYTTATPPGRINKANINYGYLNSTFGGPGTATNTTIDAALGTGSLGNYGGSHFVDVTGAFGHNLAVGDVVEFVAQAVVTCTQDFSVGSYVVEAGGAAIPVTASAGIAAYAATGGGRNVVVSIAFTWVVGTAGTFKIFVKGNVAAATTATLTVNSYMVRATRP